MPHASGNDTWADYPSTATPISAGALENVETLGDRVSAAANALLGSGNSTLPVCEYRLTTAYTNLAAGDYILSGNMTSVSDPLGMVTNPSSLGYRVTAPRAGRYDVLFKWMSSTANIGPIAHIVKNCPSGTTPVNALSGYGLLSNPGGNANGGSEVTLMGSEILAAGDYLNFLVYGAATFSMPVTIFTGIRTKFVVKYAGPN